MRACSGTWIAHGSGAADREMVDAHDRVRCRPGTPSYQLRRIWLTRGGAGLLLRVRQRGPVAAVPHRARAADVPRGRLGVLPQRQPAIRRRRGAPRRAAEDPIVLVQDYHFALLPRDDPRARCRDATILTFWHIPWPNPEAFGICPWRREMLRGHAGQQHPRLSHAASTATTSSTRWIATSRRASIASIHDLVPRADDRWSSAYPISIEWPPRAGIGELAVGDRVPRAACASAWASPRRPAARRGRRPPRLHQGHPGALQRRGAPAREAPRVDRPLHVRADRARRPAARSSEYRAFQERVRALRRAHQRALRQRRATGRSSCSAQHHEPRRGLRAIIARPTCASSAACTTA